MRRRRARRDRSKRTWYKGVWFRSRLEARWAVFFDTLKIDWEYEPERRVIQKYKTKTKTTTYLPDFYLPVYRLWIEVKPLKPRKEEQHKASEWAKEYGLMLVLFQGFRPENYNNGNWLYQAESKGGKVLLHRDIRWGQDLNSNEVRLGSNHTPSNDWDSESNRLKIAYSRAKTYRFSKKKYN